MTVEDLINKVFSLLKDRCGGQLGDSGEDDSSTLRNDGTNPTLTSVLEELRKVQEKLNHSVKTQNVLMTTIIKWVSGIEGMLDGGGRGGGKCNRPKNSRN